MATIRQSVGSGPRVGYPKEQQTRGGVQAPAPRGSITDRAEAIFGFDPFNETEKLKAAQGMTAALRGEEAEVAALASSYEARFSYPSHFEHERKAKLSVIIEQRRAEARRAGEKITEAALDSYAHSHLDYTNLLESAASQRKEWERLKARLVEIRSEIETSKAAEVYYERRIRMAEALVYHSGREASNG